MLRTVSSFSETQTFNNLLPPKGNDFNQLQIKLQEVMDECPHLLSTIDLRLHYDQEANRGLFVSM